ncbi:MAG: hypothetical protein WC455_25570 [Dehalococcoidia bacterium]|jgi:hypothetical protein
MSKLLISYISDWAAGTVTASSEHPSFPAVNTQHRWFKKPYRSRYGAGSSGGLFRITAANCKIYFWESSDLGGTMRTATLTVGDYDSDTLAAEIKTRLDAAGTFTYTPSFSATTFLWTIASTGTFVLVLSTTTNSAMPSLGWTAVVDTAAATSHTAPLIRIHTSEFLKCNLGATKTIRLIEIKNHNLQSSAVVTARFYSDAFVTLVDSVSMVWHAGQIAVRTAKSYTYMAVEFSDPSNPDGYIEIGLVWAGDAAVLHYGYTGERTKTPEDPSIETESEDGQGSTIQLSKYANWTYSFDAVEPNTDKAYLEAVFEEIGKTRPCCIVEAPPASGDVGLTAQYVKVTSWEWPHLAGTYWKLNIEIRSER